MREKIYHAT